MVRTDGTQHSALDRFDSRARLLVAFILALLASSYRNWCALAFLALAGLVYVFVFGVKNYWLLGRKLVVPTLMMFVTVLFTWYSPNSRWYLPSYDGLFAGVKIGAKIYIVSFFLFPLVVSLGVWKIEETLERFHVPEKLRVLFILTIRYVFMLSESVATRETALKLRGDCGTLSVRLHGQAALIGTTLIQCSDRGERVWQAMQLRGGLAGFHRGDDKKMQLADFLFILLGFVIAVCSGGVVYLC